MVRAVNGSSMEMTSRASGDGLNESAYKTWLSKDQHSPLDVGSPKGTGNYRWNLDKFAQGPKGADPLFKTLELRPMTYAV
jgi:hypothetical protein